MEGPIVDTIPPTSPPYRNITGQTPSSRSVEELSDNAAPVRTNFQRAEEGIRSIVASRIRSKVLGFHRRWFPPGEVMFKSSVAGWAKSNLIAIRIDDPLSIRYLYILHSPLI